jgi:hypothetical protein
MMIKNLQTSWLLTINILIFSMLTSCHDMKREADLIIYNANFYLPDSTSKDINCIAVKEGKIVGIGTDAEIRSRYWASQNINAKKAFVYPGFTDAHAHLYGYALGLQFADLTQATSFADVIEIIKGYHKQHPNSWIVGRGWDQNKWPGKQFPDNQLLDSEFPGVAVVLTRVDGHAVLASSEAMRLAGIDKTAFSPQAQRKNGVLTGIFLEEMADKLRNAIPKPTTDEIVTYLQTATRLCNEAGLTAVSDAGLNKKELLLLDSLTRAQKISLRIDAWMNPTDENLEYFVKNKIPDNPFLRVGAVKVYADGALGSRGACLLHPYTDDPTNRGILVTNASALQRICKFAYDNGYQVNTHAIGDSAVRMVLQVYTEFLKPGNNLRWRIEHAQVVSPDDLKTFGKYNIIPSVQATHATSDMPWAGQRLGTERVKTAYIYKDLLKQNGWLPNGTDFPIEDISPIKTFYAAVARKNSDGMPVEGFQAENALSRNEALRSITVWAAKAAFCENQRGTILKGNLADFTILDTDLIHCDEAKILKSKVLYTIVDGKIIYKAK